MAKIIIVTPYPLSPGDQRIIFDLAGEGLLQRGQCEVLSLIGEEPEGKNGTPSEEQLARYEAGFRADLSAATGAVLVLLDVGQSPLLRHFGLTPPSIESLRGYCLTPSDCRAAHIRERAVIGQYKTNSKHGRKGDPKYGFVTVERMPSLPSGLQWLVPSLHPKLIRTSGLKSLPCLRADIGRAVRLAQGVGSPVEFSFGSDPVPPGPMIALDLETPRGFIELVGMSDGKTTWASAWTACSADTVNKRMRNEETWKVFHNAPFDIGWLEREGIQVPGRVFDTMLAAHLIQPDLYKGLEKSSTLYLNLRPFKYLSTSELARPAADAQVTALLFHEQWRILEGTGQLDLFLDTIMPATRVLMGMTKRGLKVDRVRLDAWQAELSTKLTGLLGQWYAQTTVSPFSHHQLKKYLYGELGMPSQVDKYGRVTVDEGALKALSSQYPDHAECLSLLLSIRETAKLKSTYSEVEIGPDGCVHPSYLPESKDTDQAGAATGRLASRNPNIQNQPNEARRLFVPHEEGMVLVEADFSQIELRVAAALSNDTSLLDQLHGADVFVGIMQSLQCDRVRAKNIVYGSLYGAGPRKLSALLKQHGIPTTEVECKNLQKRLAKAYPALWAWRTTVGQAAVNERVLTNAFGRKRYFYAGSSDIPAAIDFLPQSCAADILWAVLQECERVSRGFSASIITTVHDSLLFECPKERLGSYVECITDVLEREWPQIAPGFRVPVKVKVGSNWGEMEEYRALQRV